MKNLITEGRYDKVTTDVSREIVETVKKGRKSLQTRIKLFERTFVDISVYMHYDDKKFINVYGAAYINPKSIRKYYKNKRIVLHIDLPMSLKLRMKTLSGLIPEIKNIVRHEIEHITQSKFTDRERKNFFSQSRNYPGDIEYWEYLTEPYEVEAHVRGLYKKAKTVKKPLNDMLQDYFNYLGEPEVNMDSDEIDAVKKAWIAYAKKNLPQNEMRKYGYFDEEGVEEVNYIRENHRVMGFRYKNPDVNVRISFNTTPETGNIRFKLMDMMDELAVKVNSVMGGGGNLNTYVIDINVYDEVEAQKIINDMRLKLLLNGIIVDDITYTIKK
jgi:hypothetical protein